MLTWDLHQYWGRDAVRTMLFGLSEGMRPRNLRCSTRWPQPSVRGESDAAVIEVFFDFETQSGIGVGVLHAVPDRHLPDELLVGRALYTRIEGLIGVDAPDTHPRGHGFTPRIDGETYGQSRNRAHHYCDGEPEVVVIGAGQAGLMVAAHLGQLGVDTLVVDKNERVGDNWRHRYESLCLHNPLEMNGFPYLPFPTNFPEYLPKDRMADWLEIYARYLDIKVWNSTAFLGATYDDQTHTWTVKLRSPEGDLRMLQTRHIVLATGGTGGRPRVPELPGLADFTGTVIHSSQYRSATDHDVARAIVVGTGSSAHDVAFDLSNHGVKVTMLQRGPAVVNEIATANSAYAEYFDPEVGTDLVDIRYGIGLINPLREAASRQFQRRAELADKDLHKGLTAAGMRIGDGIDGRGFLDLFLRRGGGYYFNVGASNAIIDGKIDVAQFDELVQFTDLGAQFDDGDLVEADLIVLATGYQNRRTEVAGWFGEQIADRIGDIARLDAEGEWANVWSQTAQRGLWLNAGGINQVRPGSKVLALLIKADLDGLISSALRRSSTAPRAERDSTASV